MTETQRKWVERVAEWKASGQTLREFADGKPYEAGTLGWWGSELRRRGLLGEGASKGRPVRTRSKRRQRMPPVAMATVVVRRKSAVAASTVGVAVEVCGLRVVVERGFDAEVLGSVVRALRGLS